jgi:ATPase family associated with various cellular activities (AAA)
MMVESLVEQIIHKIDQAGQFYYRLILVVAPGGMGKTMALREVARQKEFKYTNVNLELSQRLLGLTERQRSLQVFRLLNEIVEEHATQVVLFDNIELLFDTSLKQDPLRLLQGISRNRTVVASWNGSVENEHLIYAQPDHPEYRRYPTTDLLVIGVEQRR